jgi:hypothetical protein
MNQHGPQAPPLRTVAPAVAAITTSSETTVAVRGCGEPFRFGQNSKLMPPLGLPPRKNVTQVLLDLDHEAPD